MTATDVANRDLLTEELPRATHSDREHRRYLLSGKRELSKAHIRKLSGAFHVPADVLA
jgi:antitoxin component HigA of HigAB toxin-antitoxin module